ncbi:hypothetical protein D3C83_183610 [compost metagenome]
MFDPWISFKRRLAEQVSLNHKSDVPNQSLQPENVVVGDDSGICGELVSHSRPTYAGQ